MWLLLAILLFAHPAIAQDASPSATPSIIISPEPTVPPATPTPRLFDQYQRDYLFQYDIYQQAYLTYIEKAKVYTKYGTITTQKDKFNAAISAINARNKAFKSYFLALRVLLDDYKDSDPTTTQKNQIDLQKWEDWFNEQLSVVPSINNDADLKKWVDGFKEKYIDIQQAEYTALTQHEINLRQRTLNSLQDIANDIRNNPNIQPESEQWVNTLTVKSDLVTTGLNTAIGMAKKSQNQQKFSNFYPSAKIEISKANDYLVEISADLKLIITKFLKN
jgi:hypothetical protein